MVVRSMLFGRVLHGMSTYRELPPLTDELNNAGVPLSTKVCGYFSWFPASLKRGNRPGSSMAAYDLLDFIVSNSRKSPEKLPNLGEQSITSFWEP